MPSECNADGREWCRAVCLVEAGTGKRSGEGQRTQQAMGFQSRKARQARLRSGSADLWMTIRAGNAGNLPSIGSGEVTNSGDAMDR